MVYFPIDSDLKPSFPDMQFGQRLLHDIPCDVLLIDLGTLKQRTMRRVVVSMDLNASNYAIRRLVKMDAGVSEVVPVHVSPDFGPDSQKIAATELDLQLKEIGIEEEYSWLSPQVVIADDFHQGIMQAIKKDDAVVLAGSTIAMVQDLKRAIARVRPQIAESIAIAIYRPAELAAKTLLGRMGKRLKATIPELTLADRVSLFDRIQGGARLSADFVVMMGLSVLIASFGLLADNSSVVIGAMLVAPFMTPLIGFGLALVQGNIPLMKRSAVAMGAGLVIGALLSFMMGLIVPLDELPLEVLARGDPDIVDMMIAFVSGMAAAYAVSRESVAEAIVGVAIAAALVPPLACVGIMLSEGSIVKAEGALTLLITNVTAIVFGAAIVFRRLGVPGTRTEHKSYAFIRRISTTLILLLFVLSIPLVVRMAGKLAVGQTRPMGFRVSRRVMAAVYEETREREGLHVLFVGRSGSGSKKLIRILLSTDEPVPASVIKQVEAAVKKTLGRKAMVEVGVFQNAVLPDPNSSTDREDKLMQAELKE
jgi:uncharacterized hydrophobic protein (TIGR00271 family)